MIASKAELAGPNQPKQSIYQETNQSTNQPINSNQLDIQ